MAKIPETLQIIENYCEEIKGKQQTIEKYCEEIKGKQQTIEKYCEDIKGKQQTNEKYCEEIIALSYDVYLKSVAVAETRNLMVELSRQFYTLGWFVGTGGSISIKIHDDILPRAHQLIVMSPSGVQKERMTAEDTYVLSPYGSVILSPTSKPHPHKPPKYTDCAPLFLKVYEICNAGAVIHSHGTEACLVTMIDRDAKEFRIKNMEMIKGIEGHGYSDELVVPIIENTPHEGDLLVPFTQAIRAYTKTKAVLVRNHGVFIWGDSWIRAKTQAECYHYLFDAAIKLRQLGLNWPTSKELPNENVCKFKC